MDTLAEKRLKCCDYFFRLSGFTDLSGKVFLFKVFLKYREIITIKSVKNKKKKLGQTVFYYVRQEIWLDNSKKLISRDQPRF